MQFLSNIRRDEGGGSAFRVDVFVLLFLIFFVSGCAARSQIFLGQGGAVDGYFNLKGGGERREIKIENEGVNYRSNYVSIAKVGVGEYVVANYNSLLLLSRLNGDVCILRPLDSDFKSVYEKRENNTVSRNLRDYNPTGVASDSLGNLYVANYKGNNVLVFSVDVPKCELSLKGEYRSHESMGPENVAVIEARDILLVANYDAGTVVAFSISTGKKLWSAAVPQAHGVAEFNGRVYATGLTERKIYEISIDTGEVLRSTGSLGWNPMVNQFMWPVSINKLNDEKLIISDAHTGYVSVFDAASMQVESYFGGNGPTYKRFNYPYAAVKIDDEVVVLSSMRGHILFLDADARYIKEEMVVDRERWHDLTISDDIFGHGWSDYVNNASDARLSINGVRYKLGYAHLHPVDGGPVLRVPDTYTMLNPGAYLYFLQGLESQDVSAFFSSSGTQLLVAAHRRGKPDFIYTRALPLDSWKIGNEIFSPSGARIDAARILLDVKPFVEKMDSIYAKYGWVSIPSFIDLIGTDWLGTPGRKDKESLAFSLFEKVFSTVDGVAFYGRVKNCDYLVCAAIDVKNAAHKYFDSVRRQAYANFDEVALISMISGVVPNLGNKIFSSKVRMSYFGCESSKYYPGYGPEALATEDLTDYLSAEEITSSSVCFSADGEGVREGRRRIQIGWLLPEEVAAEFEVVELMENGSRRSLGVFRNPDVFLNGDYLYSTIDIPDFDSSSSIMVRLIKGGQQDRLLLRSLHVE